MATVFSQSWGVIGSTITCSFANIANGAIQQSTEVDNSVLRFLDAHVLVTCMTTGLAVSSTGTLEVYGYGQVGDAKPWRTDTAGATDAAITNLPNARLLGVMQANSGLTIYAGGPFSVANAFGGILPFKWGVLIANRTGANTHGSGGVNNLFYSGYYETGT